MLIPFYLDEHFFDSVYFYDEDFDSAHDNFLKFWENYGVLIYSNNQNIMFYRNLIKKFPINFHQRWNAALLGFSKFDANNESFDKFKNCQESYNNLASKKNFYNFGLTDKDSFKLVQNLKDFQDFEVRCLENYTTSVVYNNILFNATCIIDDGEDIESVWDKKFKNLLKYTSSVTILALYTTNFTEPLSYQASAFLKLPKFP